MDVRGLDLIKARFAAFYESSESLPNIEEKLFKFLFNEIFNDLRSKNVKSFHDWLIYYSTEGNDINDVSILCQSYLEKVLQKRSDEITIEEKVLMFNALALYSIEMDIEPVDNSNLRGKIFQTFIEIIEHYKLVQLGYLSMKGQILISDRNKCTFYSVWSAGGVVKETPINLF